MGLLSFRGFLLMLFVLPFGIAGGACTSLWDPSPPVTPGYCGELCSTDFWKQESVDVSAVQAELAKGTDLAAANRDGATALHLAVTTADPQVVRLLLNEGANPGAKDDYGVTVLHYAVSSQRGKDADVIGLLLDAGADAAAVDEYGRTVLHFVSSLLTEEAMRELLEAGADPFAVDENGRTVLHNWAYIRNVKLTRLLLDRGVNAGARDDRGSIALGSVLSLCQFDVDPAAVDLFLEHGADPHVRVRNGQTPLHTVMQARCDPVPPPHVAIELEVAAVLLAHGADIVATDLSGNTPLHLAMWQCNPKVVEFLLDHGAGANAKNGHGETPLHQAVGSCKTAESSRRVAQSLLDHGANPNEADNEGNTALHWAAGSYRNDATGVEIPILLDGGGLVTVKNDRGETPCSLALAHLRSLVCE